MPPDGDQPVAPLFSVLAVAASGGVCAGIVPHLTRLGCQVREVETMHDALAQCSRHAYRLVVLDYDGQDMQGMAFLNALRAVPEAQRPPIIFCGAWAGAAEIGQAICAGAADFLLPPFDTDLIAFKLRQIGLGLGAAA